VSGRTVDPLSMVERFAGADGPWSTVRHVGLSVAAMSAWPSPAELTRRTLQTLDRVATPFVLGVGLGHPTGGGDDRERRPVAFAADYLERLRRSLEEASPTTRIPVALAALGPRMLGVAGAAADGVILNWASADLVAWSRDVVADGARRARRDPAAIGVMTQVRVAIDDDQDAARSELARHLVRMTIREPVEPADRGYRAHIRRLGFGDLFDELAHAVERGAAREDLAHRVPSELIDAIAYGGPAAGARDAVRRVAGAADLVLVRPIPMPGLGRSAIAAALACGSDAR
jgi:alkanesulfonate monooxygenase SsuD/methylene tetrahydromethanopterin reductase-like flavin-dependent oxidoreductase (luciferase family)